MNDSTGRPATLQERATEAIAALGLDDVTNVRQLKERIERVRETQIEIIPTKLLNGIDICGVWGKRGNKDVILHAETDSELHRDQIVLHELSHMLLDHQPEPGEENRTFTRALFPDLNPDHFLLRAGLRTQDEREAEFLADMLAQTLRLQRRQATNFQGVFG